jgi:hypothetical protein
MMGTVPGSGWAFVFWGIAGRISSLGESLALTERVLTGIRRLRIGVTGALLLTCGTALPAQNPQQAPQPAASGAATTTHAAAHKPSTSQTHKTATGQTSASNRSYTASTSGKRPVSRRKRTAKTRGQLKIDSERVQAIQEALIREHYLTGEATGAWTVASEDAMRRYQADHGWQSKTVPDSRALIKLGLGPSHDHLLNPESAMTTAPDAPRATSLTPASHSADPGPRMNSNTPAPADPAPAPTPAPEASSPH